MKKQRGQVALIVLIVSAISLTVGLALSDRIRTGVRVSKDDEMLERAFNTAESAIDNYLAQGQITYTTQSGDSGLVNVSPVGGQIVEFGELVERDGYAYFWLVGHNSDGSLNVNDRYDQNNLTICYDDFSPGGFMVYYFYQGAVYGVTRRAFNLSSSQVAIQNGTNVVTGESECSGYNGRMSLSLSEGALPGSSPLLLVIKPVGGNSRFAVNGGTFPSQGDLISSTGSSGEANTTVRIMKRWDPSMYMFFMLEGMVALDTIN